MTQIQSGASADLLTIDPTFGAARVSIRPPEVTGAYRMSLRSGNIAAATAANSMLAAFRYTGTGIAIIHSIRVGLHLITAYTAGSVVLSAFLTRSYTVTETTNYTAATMTGNKLRSSYAASSALFGIATTTGISGGTGTDDSHPTGSCTFNLPNTITGQPIQDFYTMSMQSHPILLTQNEGFRIRNDTAFAATGVSNLVVSIEWAEAAAY